VSGRTLHPVERAVGWIVGVPFASWRYVSREIEIRHEESSCDWAIDAFPEDDCRHPGRPGLLQRPSGGSGAAFRRRYRVSVERPLLSADELMSIVLADPNVACPLEIGRFEREVESSRTIELGEEMRVRLPGAESESTESPKRPAAIEEVVREEPAPRYRIRRDDGRERIDALAAGALCKAGTRSTAEGSGRPGDGTAHLMGGPTARRAWACSKRDACAPPARTPTFLSMREESRQRGSVGLRSIGRRRVASDLRPGGPTRRPGHWPLERNTAFLDWHEPALQSVVALLRRMNAPKRAPR
jgi:hypothetical protein